MNATADVMASSSEVAEDLFVTLEEVLPEIAIWQNGSFMGNREIINLLGDTPEELKINRAEKTIKTNNDIWVDYLYFDTDDQNIVESSIRISVKDISGKTTDIPLSYFIGSNKKRYPIARIKSFVKEIKFKSEARFRRPRIKKIMINGFSLDSFKDVSEKISDALNIKKNIESIKQSTIDELQEKNDLIKEKNDEITSLTETIYELKIENENLSDGIKSDESALKAINDAINISLQKETILKSSIEKLSEESRLLNIKITQEDQKIKELENDKNVFSDEFVDYVSASKTHTRLYAFLTLIPLVVIAICVIILYWNANSFLHRGDYSLAEVASDFLLRIPFSIATASIAYLSWRICEQLIKKCIDIHQAQRDLSKILVIAKETVFSSSSELDLPDEIKFSERIKLKVQMIRNHLKNEISNDFDYQVEDIKTERKQDVEDVATN